MQAEKKGVCLLVVVVVVFLLLAYSNVYISPPLMLLGKQTAAVHELRGGPPTCCPSGFVLVMRYAGQQGAGIRALKSVQNWIKDLDLPMMIVEPFLQNSVMGVHPQKKGEEQSVKFSDMFDMDTFNAVSRSEGSPEMIAWSDYIITNATREAVFIEMKGIYTKEKFQPPTIQQSIHDGRGLNECTIQTITAPDNRRISLCQVREVKAKWIYRDTRILTHEDMYDSILRGLDPTNVTLIFSFWHGLWEVATDSEAVHNITDNDSSTDLDHKFQDSPKLHHYMEIYQKKFLTAAEERESRYVAVMIRAEHTVRQLKWDKRSKIPEKLEECLYELQDETNEAMRLVGASKLLVTSDVGNYGSGTWHSRSNEVFHSRVKRGVERLYMGREGWSFEQWEHSFIDSLGGVTDRGYVAALQRVLATSSKTACLVLMGGGRFQELSLENYLHNTRHKPHTRCVQLVCMERLFEELFKSMLAKG